jgi:hypothetical protein
MVAVDMQVALRVNRQIDQAVARELFQHVVEKADSGGDVVAAGAVEIHGRCHLGFLGSPLYCRPPHRC